MTTLAFNLDPADIAITALLRDIENIDLHVGHVTDSDDSAKTVSAPVPYLLYSSGVGYASRRAGGWAGRTVPFTVTYTHGTFYGAKAVALATRDYLDGATVTIDGRVRRIRLQDPDENVVVEHDREWSRPGGEALYFGMDRFWVEA